MDMLAKNGRKDGHGGMREATLLGGVGARKADATVRGMS